MLFKDVLGHNDLKEKFVNDVRSEQVSHAHLLLGNIGYGGLPIALALSQFLMCENRQENDSCGNCASCSKVQKLEHPDIHFSFPTTQAISKTSDPEFQLWKKNVLRNPYMGLNEWINVSDDKGRKPIISVHQSEAIIKKLTLKSFEGGYKISIIWLAETMNTACANKLLKIIEEPPKDTLFILIVENEDTVLPTILSRTQITKIKQLNDDDLVKFLRNKGNSDEDLLRSISSRAEGDVSSALEMIGSGENSNTNYQRFVELMRVCYKKEVLPMMFWAETMSKLSREDQKHFLKYALYMVRQSLMKNYTEDQLMRTSSDEANFLSKFARFITGNNVLNFNDLFNDAHYNVERNAHSKLLFTNITFEVMRYIHKA
ncbi:DNA polymerase III subunit [Brumimicrobium mesophilum]|uniref:DNA polymerase III subunit n=1 Tax=Brumimicrobium mesophilum TaxID=392717 RepID=UPI000D1414A0|nr:DNA polymerase III subunit delta' [Brumimicrobium mesophilum]